MIMDKGYLDEMKEHIEVMQEGYFVRRGLTKERVLNDKDTMERLWMIYQKDVEDYGCDREFSRDDAMDEVFGPEPKKAELKYRCPFCRSKRFIGHQIVRTEVYVGEDGDFDGNLPNGLRRISTTPSGHTARSSATSAGMNLMNFRKTGR